MIIERCAMHLNLTPCLLIRNDTGKYPSCGAFSYMQKGVALGDSIESIVDYDCIYAIIFHMPITLVIDTSVFISALIGTRGPGREVLRRCLKGDYDPIISNALYLEYEEVSKRKRILDACPLSGKEIRDLFHAFYGVCTWVPIYYLWRPNSVDEGDNFLIELALAGNASHIVTNNIGDLQNTELKFPSLSIVKPEELLRGN